VVLLSLTEGDFSDYGGRDEVLVVTKETRLALKLGGTPQTIVVSPEGKVQRNWFGAYADNTNEVESALGVTLPGLLPAKPVATATYQ